MKHIIPILVILLFVSSGFVGVSNTAEEQWVDAEQKSTDEEYPYNRFNEHHYPEGYFSGQNPPREYDDVGSSEVVIENEMKTVIGNKNHKPQQTATSGGPMDSPWPMQSYDLHHTGRSPYSTANVTGLEKWRFYNDGWVQDTPVIDNDGTIYFGGNYGGLPWYLFAVNPDGTEKWKYKTDGLILGSSPAISEDGTIYVGSWDYGGRLYAINPDGTLKWRCSANGASISSSPAIAEDGTIYFGTLWSLGDGGKIHAINPNGTEKWRYQTGDAITSSPAIGDDGTIYIGSDDTYFYALYSNGTLRWRFKTGDWVGGSPSIGDDGTIYIGSFDGYLYALYQNGTLKWKVGTSWGIGGAPIIGNDGTIYAATNKLRAFYPNGTLKWSFDFGNRNAGWSSPAISADGTIYVGVEIEQMGGGEIIAVNPDGTEKWRKRIADDWTQSSPSIAEDGTVYIGSADTIASGYLHAFGPVESNSPPEAPTITGKINGKAGTEYKYTFVANDPDSNPISFYIEWDDGTPTDWTHEYASSEKVKIYHTFYEQGTYNISAKVKDVLGEESDWGYLEVTMPMNQQTNSWWFLQFLQNHPRMFPILRQILSFVK